MKIQRNDFLVIRLHINFMVYTGEAHSMVFLDHPKIRADIAVIQ